MPFAVIGGKKKKQQAHFTVSVENIMLKENKAVLPPGKTMKHPYADRPSLDEPWNIKLNHWNKGKQLVRELLK